MSPRSSILPLFEILEPRLVLSSSAAGLVDWSFAAAYPSALTTELVQDPQVGGKAKVSGRVRVSSIALYAPTSLVASGDSATQVSLTWSDTSSGESGFYVYRATGSGAFKKVATIPSNTGSFTDTSVAASSTYTYYVQAYKGKSTSAASAKVSVTTPVAPAPEPAPEPTPPPSPLPPPPPPPTPAYTSNAVDISTRFGTELVITGTGGNDSISVSQSGLTLTIVANGSTYTYAAPTAGLFVYSNLGQDTITIDASTSLRTSVVAIDSSTTTVNAFGGNVSTWIDSTDVFVGSGAVHRVASYANGASKAIGVDIADPTDTGAVNRYVASLWGVQPVAADVNQGSVGDCYLLASIAGFAQTSTAKLMEMAVDMGDGTYVVNFVRSGVQQFVRVDADFAAGGWNGFAYAHPGASGASWAVVLEKAYAFFRYGQNTYASLNSGWMSAVFNDFGVASSGLSVGTNQQTFFNTVSSKLAAGKAVTLGTGSSAPNLVGGHAYTVMSASMDASGNSWYVVRNPWGFAGTGSEGAGGLVTLSYAQMQANFTLGGVMAA